MSTIYIEPRLEGYWLTALAYYAWSLRMSRRGYNPRTPGKRGDVWRRNNRRLHAALCRATKLETIPLGVYSQFEKWAHRQL